jgi:hypothetical protein
MALIEFLSTAAVAGIIASEFIFASHGAICNIFSQTVTPIRELCPHSHPPLSLRCVVLCVIPVDRLLAVLDDCHHSIVWPTPEPLLVDRQRPPHRIKEAGRVYQIFVGAPALWMRDFDEAILVSILAKKRRKEREEQPSCD